MTKTEVSEVSADCGLDAGYLEKSKAIETNTRARRWLRLSRKKDNKTLGWVVAVRMERRSANKGFIAESP